MDRKAVLIGVAASALLAACASPSAQTPPPSAAAVKEPAFAEVIRQGGYLPPGAVDGLALLGPPPAPGSPRGRADRATYDQTRALAGSPRWALATRDNDLTAGGALKRFACASGKDLSREATPVTLRMLIKMMVDVHNTSIPPKDHYARLRPALGDDKPICVPRADWMKTNASYPSGHAMIGWSWALVLAELQPSRASDLYVAGADFGRSRVICGVHYESDVEAGQMLGAAMLSRLHAEPAFAADLAAARAELAATTATPAGCDS